MNQGNNEVTNRAENLKILQCVKHGGIVEMIMIQNSSNL